MWISVRVCGHGWFLWCDCVDVCLGMCVWACVSVLPSDLWGLSATASSLSPLAWRMNGPLSALPQPLLLVSLSNYLSSSLSSPLFTSALSYLPTCSSSACTLSSSLPFIHPLLCSLGWFDPYFPLFRDPRPLLLSQQRVISSVDLLVLWPNPDLQSELWFQGHFIRMWCIRCRSSVSISPFRWLDGELA